MTFCFAVPEPKITALICWRLLSSVGLLHCACSYPTENRLTHNYHHSLTHFLSQILLQYQPNLAIVHNAVEVQGWASLWLVTSPHPDIYIPLRSMPIEKRKAEAERIRQKYPDRIPVSSCTCEGNLTFFNLTLRTCFIGHLWEGRSHRYPHHRQKEVSRAVCAYLLRFELLILEFWIFCPYCRI